MASEPQTVPEQQKVVFTQTVEGLTHRALRGRRTVRMDARMREAGFDPDARLLPAYPKALWLALVHISAEEAFPGLPRPDALRALGELMVEGYTQTVVGSALMGVMRVIGPRRTLERTGRNFRSGTNYVEARLETLGPDAYALWVSDVHDTAPFTAGIIEAGLRAAGAPDVEALPDGRGGPDCTFTVRWGAGRTRAADGDGVHPSGLPPQGPGRGAASARG
jgi:uncharacterized protein (TIGR02265 family)